MIEQPIKQHDIEMMIRIKTSIISSGKTLEVAPLRKAKIMEMCVNYDLIGDEEVKIIKYLISSKKVHFLPILYFAAFTIGYDLYLERPVNKLDMIFLTLMTENQNEWQSFKIYMKEFNGIKIWKR
jgi:hypothetical protein